MELMDIKAYAGIIILLVWTTLFVLVGLVYKNIKINPAREIKTFLKKQSVAGRIVFLLFFLVMTIYGGTKPSDNSDSTSNPKNISNRSHASNNNSISKESSTTIANEIHSSKSHLSLLPTDFSNEQKACGFVLTGIRTDDSYNFALPTNGVAYTPWLKYGASDDMFVYEQNSPIITHGTNSYKTARIYSQGAISFGDVTLNVFDTIVGIPPTNNWDDVGEPMLWYQKKNGSIIYTWQDVLLNRAINENMSFQLEIQANGDIISRYDARVTEYIKNHNNLNYCISTCGYTNEIIALNNTCSATNHTCTTIYEFSSTEGITAIPLCSIIEPIQGGFSLYWKNISNLSLIDEDNDGLSNFEEICIYKTDCNNSDTDGDNRSDSHEVQNGFSPVNADENNDSVPDGVDFDEWASHPLWCTDGTPSIIITLDTPIPTGTSASLMLNDLTIPLSETNSWAITLPAGELINVRLQSTGTEPIDLHLSSSQSESKRSATNDIWVDDPSGLFDGNARNQGTAKLSNPTIHFYDIEAEAYASTVCLHHSRNPSKVFRMVFSPREFQDSIIPENLTLEGLELIGDNLVRLTIDEESESAYGYVSYDWFCKYFEYGHAFAMINIHWCDAINTSGYCIHCSHQCIDFENIVVDINGDYNRTGQLINHENEGESVLFENPKGIVIPVNNNDTNQDGIPDCNDTEINGSNDLNELKRIKIETLNIPSYFADHIDGQLIINTRQTDIDTSKTVTNKIRIFDGTTISAEPLNFVYGHDGKYYADIPDKIIQNICTNPQELLIEGCWHGSQINISLEIRINGTLFKSDYISILTAPFFVLSNCDQAKKLFMGYYSDWCEVYNSITNSNFLDIPIEITGHPYLQDYAEFGASIDSNGEYYPVIMDFNSNNFNDETSPNTGFFSLATGGEGGNIEGLPVSEQHPYGRVIVGSTLKNRQPQIYNFLKNQKIQGELIELDTDWLQVGHVDEIISIVPTANSYKIFVFDTQLAIDIFATNVNNSTIFYPEILKKTYSSYTNLQNQALVNFMTNRTAEIFTTLSNNNIETMQIVSVPVLFSLGVQSASDQESHSKCILFNPLNSVYLNVNGENKAILSVGLYAPYCSYYFDLLVTLGYNNGNILPINTISMQNGGGSIHCATNIKRER